MKRLLCVLLVEDDARACAEIVCAIDNLETMCLVSVTNNASKAIALIKDHMPDAVILDLELHDGGGNGLSVLQEMKQLSLPALPYVLVTTNNSSALTHEAARTLGADFILSKHQEGYTAKSAVDFLEMMRGVIQNRAATSGAQTIEESPQQKNKRRLRRICTELNLVGISPKAIGYRYLADAIELTMQEPSQNLCNQLGKKHNKTEASVARAVQNAINKAWRTSPIEDLLVHYTAKISSDKGVPTITEFVYYYAIKIANEYDSV